MQGTHHGTVSRKGTYLLDIVDDLLLRYLSADLLAEKLCYLLHLIRNRRIIRT